MRSPQIMSVQAAAAAELAGDCTADPRAAVTAARRERHPETTSGLGRVARIPMISLRVERLREHHMKAFKKHRLT